jgi:hypothetical protein
MTEFGMGQPAQGPLQPPFTQVAAESASQATASAQDFPHDVASVKLVSQPFGPVASQFP